MLWTSFTICCLLESEYVHIVTQKFWFLSCVIVSFRKYTCYKEVSLSTFICSDRVCFPSFNIQEMVQFFHKQALLCMCACVDQTLEGAEHNFFIGLGHVLLFYKLCQSLFLGWLNFTLETVYYNLSLMFYADQHSPNKKPYWKNKVKFTL
jgi:hypothetical protein